VTNDNSLKMEMGDNGEIESIEFKGEEYSDFDSLEDDFPHLKGAGQIAKYTQQSVQPVLRSIQPMFDVLDQITDMMEGIAEWREASKAVGKDIQKFPHIDNYQPENVEISEDAVNVAETEVERFLYTMEEHQDTVPEKVDYTNRLDKGLQAFREENYLTATFVFMSLQDGLMSLICRMKDVKGTYYNIDQKSETLAEDFTTLIGLESDKIEEKVKHFWSHRKAVMHGDAEAYYGEKVAKVSLLFLHATISTMFQIEIDEEEN
jgi:hypothetical protein